MLRCPFCELGDPCIKVVYTRAPYRQRRCTNCAHEFFTFNEDLCTKAEFYAHDKVARDARKALEAKGQAPERRKGPTHNQVATTPAREVVAVRTLATGHTVEYVPGGRVYRMKL